MVNDHITSRRTLPGILIRQYVSWTASFDHRVIPDPWIYNS